jgi:uncharacterized protein YcaQ
MAWKQGRQPDLRSRVLKIRDAVRTRGLKKEKGLQEILQALSDLAEWTGLEPATPGVTGRYSNQLNYHSW